MLSGITRCVAPLSSGTPSISSTSVPIPWILAPILPRNMARSTTCGSRAALWMVVIPSAVAAAIIRFSVPVTVGMSRWMVAPLRRSARATYSPPSSSTLAPISRKPTRCCSTRRMPMSSPPGLATRASPRRASSGPIKRKDARIRFAIAASTSLRASRSALICSCWGSSQRIWTPIPSRRRIMVATSSIRGTFLSRHSSSVSRQAARMGRTAFLEPLIGTRPTNRVPPSIRSWATDLLGYQPSCGNGAIWSLRDLGAAAAAQLGQSQPGLGSRQRHGGCGLIGIGEFLLQEVRRPAARFLGARLVDVLGPFRRIRQHGDFVGPHFEESARDEEKLFLVLVAHFHDAWLERGQQRDVPRQDAELSIRARCHHEVGIAFEAPAFDGDDVDVQLVLGQGVPSAWRMNPPWFSRRRPPWLSRRPLPWLSPAPASSPVTSSRLRGPSHPWRRPPPRRSSPPCRKPAPAGHRACLRGSR